MNTVEKTVINNLKEKSFFTKKDVEDNFNKQGLFISSSSLNIKIFRWRKKGLIHDVAKGKYVINNKLKFTPTFDKFIDKVHKLYISKFEDIDYCIWSTSWLANFMNHVPFQYFYVLEIEKDVCESAFYYLKDEGINVYYEVDSKQIEKYILPEVDSIIIRPLITRSPCKKQEEISYASIEKILVDIFCDVDIYYLYSGNELEWIYKNIIKTFNINFSTLLNYAERRKRDQYIKEYLFNKFNDEVKGFIL